MKNRRLLVATFILCLSVCSQGASFDCKKGESTVEKLICSDKELSLLDDNLSSLYRYVLKESDGNSASIIRKEQRLWLKQDRDICQDKTCISNVYRQRIEYLGDIESVRQNDLLKEKNFVPGRFPEERIKFLQMLELEAEAREDYTYGNDYLVKALNDSSPDVRKYAAYSLRGSEYVEQLIHVLRSDSDPKVRGSASIGLSAWLTDNGSDNCGDVEIVERNLSDLLDAMYDVAASRSVVEILGARFAGNTPMACCMSQDGKNKTVKALNNLKDNMPYKPNSQNMRYALDEVGEALKNISSCE